MKDISDLKIKDGLRYSDDHEWCQVDGDLVKVGISDYAQDQLGDIVFVELPQVGATINKGDSFASVESVKAVSDCFLPISGEVVEVNADLDGAPEKINESPYDEGWIVVIKPSDPSELDALMDAKAYLEMLKAGE